MKCWASVMVKNVNSWRKIAGWTMFGIYGNRGCKRNAYRQSVNNLGSLRKKNYLLNLHVNRKHFTKQSVSQSRTNTKFHRIVPYRALSCRIVPYRALPCLIVPYRALSCLIVPYRALSCLIVPYRALSCLIVPYRALSCRIMPYRALSCLLNCLRKNVKSDSLKQRKTKGIVSCISSMSAFTHTPDPCWQLLFSIFMMRRKLRDSAAP